MRLAFLCSAVVLCCFGLRPIHGQSPLPDEAAAFEPLPLPTPNVYRSASGRPGPAYWQQEVDYHIRVALDPDSHRVSGSEIIAYTNHSPDSLDVLWLHLDQNKFAPGSRGELLFGDARYRGAFPEGGLDLRRLAITHDAETYTPDIWIDGTRMRVDLRRTLPPEGGRLTLEIDWSFVVPEYGADRMGRFDAEAGLVYQIAQWYPRLAVYDDVSGWNALPYLGQGEFYLEFGTFDVEITVPHDHLVVATGVLQNAETVYTTAQRARIEQARTSAETIPVVAAEDVGARAARPPGEAPLTWRFRAERVRDFAWAASPAFLLDAASWEDVLILSAYPAEGLGTPTAPGWERATEYARHSIAHYSARWLRYPYPVVVNVGGGVEGMEYPMLHFSPVGFRGDVLFDVVDHEVAHNWFPMIVASDERRHAWMDEGFATFIGEFSRDEFLPPTSPLHGLLDLGRIARNMQHGNADQPLTTATDRLRPFSLGFQSYFKPAAGLMLLRDYLLGPDRFDRALRAYARRWAFKHPQPADFYRTIEDVSGEELDWFWRGWFYSTGRVDQAVDFSYSNGETTSIQVSNPGDLVLPVHLRLTYADGTTEDIRLPVEIWHRTDAYLVTLPARGPLTGIAIDPDALLPDINRANNRWQPTRD